MDADRHLTTKEESELMAMLFLHGMALASWFVPLGSVLDAAKLGSIKAMAFAAFAIAAILSPLFFGAMADRSVAPARVLRWTSFATSASICLIAWAIETRMSSWSNPIDDPDTSVVLQPNVELGWIYCLLSVGSIKSSIWFDSCIGNNRLDGRLLDN